MGVSPRFVAVRPRPPAGRAVGGQNGSHDEFAQRLAVLDTGGRRAVAVSGADAPTGLAPHAQPARTAGFRSFTSSASSISCPATAAWWFSRTWGAGARPQGAHSSADRLWAQVGGVAARRRVVVPHRQRAAGGHVERVGGARVLQVVADGRLRGAEQRVSGPLVCDATRHQPCRASSSASMSSSVSMRRCTNDSRMRNIQAAWVTVNAGGGAVNACSVPCTPWHRRPASRRRPRPAHRVASSGTGYPRSVTRPPRRRRRSVLG